MECLSQKKVLLSIDMDFTLADFKAVQLNMLMIRSMNLVLIRDKNYPVEILPEDQKEEVMVAKQGFRAVYDQESFNLLKVSSEGFILRGYSGRQRLTEEQLREEYGDSLTIPVNKQSFKSDRYKFFSELFICYLVGPLMKIIELRKTRQYPVLNELTGKQLLQDMYSTSAENYEFVRDRQYKDPSEIGYFYPYFIAEHERYLSKPSATLEKLLKKKSLIKLLCTNGEIGHLSAVKQVYEKMSSDILNSFDFIVVDAKKPEYFTTEKDLVRYDPSISTDAKVSMMRGIDIEVFTESSSKTLLQHIKSHHFNIGTKIHIGDSPTADNGSTDGYLNIVIFRELLEDVSICDRSEVPDVDNILGYLETWGSALSDRGHEVLAYGIVKGMSMKVFWSLDSKEAILYLDNL